ncbi:hypothetical protein Pan216_22400 [Planctomycetes bacterium Pan216]|uniref:Mannosylglycerate hydrolase MGH1-like glycoside hydrolase domain-containing protein n=1 Tax=Kolteria novifilia TaxID=2527975 RepID=A0A518B370_9BACT|nr:hypothetical protein Pan216_22400 [Planctomycetes bacterium Pan216]
MTGLDVLNLELSLPDEWQLGGGRRVVWAPRTPAFLDEPGFRDPGSYLGYPIDPVFGITLLDRDARPIRLERTSREWNPARLEVKYRSPQALVTEQRTVLGLDACVSRWTMSHAAEVSRHYWLVLWTRRPNARDGHRLADIEANPQGISLLETIDRGPDLPSLKWGCALGASFDADSWSVDAIPSSGSPSAGLNWEASPFYDLMAPGGLPGHSSRSDNGAGDVYVGLAYPFEVPPGERLVATFAAAFAPDVEQARSHLDRACAMINPIQQSEEEWINWFDDVPEFTCSDPQLQRLYWYRWAQRKIWGGYSTDAPASADDEFRITAEGDDPVGRLIEMSWHHVPDLVHAELRSLLSRNDDMLASVSLAHAVRQVLSLQPDLDFLTTLEARFRPIVRRMLEQDDSAESDSVAIDEVNAPVPTSLQEKVFGLDLLKLTCWLNEQLGRDVGSLKADIRRFGERIVEEHWDKDEAFFVDHVRSNGGTRKVKPAAGFLPMLVSLADEDQLSVLLDRLCDPEMFWTVHPVPSLSRDDRDFNPDGRWDYLRIDRPYHGRVWPTLNSLIVDALGKSIEFRAPVDRMVLVELVDRVTRLAYPEGDGERPAFHEHYNPLNGRPSAFLGRSHEGGGWLIDHLIRYVSGVRPSADGHLLIDPLPFRLQWFSLSRCFVGEHEIDVAWDHRAGLTVHINERPAGHAPVGQALSIKLPDYWPMQIKAS